MKVKMIPVSAILSNRWTSLNAVHYVCPTKDIDVCIARTETTLANAQKRLKKLKAERDIILTANEHGELTPDGRLVSADKLDG